ncbi:MAG: hypothetical protein R3E68_15965 [Burkholderiaceae bacterium]
MFHTDRVLLHAPTACACWGRWPADMMMLSPWPAELAAQVGLGNTGLATAGHGHLERGSSQHCRFFRHAVGHAKVILPSRGRAGWRAGRQRRRSSRNASVSPASAAAFGWNASARDLAEETNDRCRGTRGSWPAWHTARGFS